MEFNTLFLKNIISNISADKRLAKKWFFILRFNVILTVIEMPYYAVAVGKIPGVYTSWPECQNQTKNYPQAKFKKFNTESEAANFVKTNGKQIEVKASSTNVSVTPLMVENCKHPEMKAIGKYGSQTLGLLKQDKISLMAEKLDNFIEETNKKLNEFSNRLLSLETFFTVGASNSPASSNKRKIETSIENKDGGKTKKKKPLVTIEVLNEASNLSNSTSTRSKKVLTSDTDEGVEEVDSPWIVGRQDNFNVSMDGYVIVYTDGACTNNGRKGARAGVGVWFNHNNPYNVAAPVQGPATNNNAEIQAATRAIEQAQLAGIKRLNIHTDSQFMINCITDWIIKWKKNNWTTSTGGPVKNKEQLVILDHALENMEAVKWTHIRGHVGIEGNECADALARSGASMY